MVIWCIASPIKTTLPVPLSPLGGGQSNRSMVLISVATPPLGALLLAGSSSPVEDVDAEDAEAGEGERAAEEDGEELMLLRLLPAPPLPASPIPSARERKGSAQVLANRCSKPTRPSSVVGYATPSASPKKPGRSGQDTTIWHVYLLKSFFLPPRPLDPPFRGLLLCVRGWRGPLRTFFFVRC